MASVPRHYSPSAQFRGTLIAELWSELIASIPSAENGATGTLDHAPDPDPAIAPDAGQWFRVVLFDHIEQCSEEDCGNETRCAAESSDTEPIPYCTAHVHVVFADWMVGV